MIGVPSGASPIGSQAANVQRIWIRMLVLQNAIGSLEIHSFCKNLILRLLRGTVSRNLRSTGTIQGRRATIRNASLFIEQALKTRIVVVSVNHSYYAHCLFYMFITYNAHRPPHMKATSHEVSIVHHPKLSIPGIYATHECA